jgi:hypothetical protein
MKTQEPHQNTLAYFEKESGTKEKICTSLMKKITLYNQMNHTKANMGYKMFKVLSEIVEKRLRVHIHNTSFFA